MTVMTSQGKMVGPGLSWVSPQGNWELAPCLPPDSPLACLPSAHLPPFPAQALTCLLHIPLLQFHFPLRFLTVYEWPLSSARDRRVNATRAWWHQQTSWGSSMCLTKQTLTRGQWRKCPASLYMTVAEFCLWNHNCDIYFPLVFINSFI